MEAGSTFGVMVLFALASVFVLVVVYPVALVATVVYVWSRVRKWTPEVEEKVLTNSIDVALLKQGP